MADMGGTLSLAVTPSGTITLTIDTGVRHLQAAWTAGQAETVNISGTPLDGQELTLLITNDATLGRLITFNTGFSANGTGLGIISKRSLFRFYAIGGTFYEASRVLGVLT
jgi:hypothetical protein